MLNEAKTKGAGTYEHGLELERISGQKNLEIGRAHV